MSECIKVMELNVMVKVISIGLGFKQMFVCGGA